MDGVLVDTEPIYIEINRNIFKRFGVELPKKYIHKYVGIAAEQMWDELRVEFELELTTEELIRLEGKMKLSAIQSGTLESISGIEELLRQSRSSDLSCAIASSSSRELISLVLDKTDLIEYFAAVVSGEDVLSGKPAPDIFLLAAEKLKTNPGSCLVIEDSTAGIRGAKTAGMATCGFLNPNSGDQDLKNADILIDDFGEICRAQILGKHRLR